MRGVQLHEWTEPQNLRVLEVAEPVCKPHEVKIKVQASPVSHALGLLVSGKYQRKPAFPFVPGNTIVGEIVELGSHNARGFSIGQLVLASTEFGGLAEYAVADELNTYALPATVDPAEATALNTAYNSVYAALTWPRLLDVKPGSWLLVHGAAGGTGSAAIEIARQLGARIIATASTQTRRDWALSLGAEHAISSDPAQFRDEVLELTRGQGVNAVLDPVGGEVFTQSIRCLAPEGRIVPLGFASGDIPKVAVNHILVKNISVCGLYMGYHKIDAREQYEPAVRSIFETLGTWLSEGKIRPRIDARLPLDQVGAGFTRIADRNRIGQVVLMPNG